MDIVKAVVGDLIKKSYKDRISGLCNINFTIEFLFCEIKFVVRKIIYQGQCHQEITTDYYEPMNSGRKVKLIVTDHNKICLNLLFTDRSTYSQIELFQISGNEIIILNETERYIHVSGKIARFHEKEARNIEKPEETVMIQVTDDDGCCLDLGCILKRMARRLGCDVSDIELYTGDEGQHRIPKGYLPHAAVLGSLFYKVNAPQVSTELQSEQAK
jgi:hypothetical protein